MLNLQNIDDAKGKLQHCDTGRFNNKDVSFRNFLKRIKVTKFRHILDLEIFFTHPVTVISWSNKIWKTSILLLIACSHFNFKKIDSTKPDTILRRHTWGDVLAFTNYESTTQNYSYELDWRVWEAHKSGEGKRLPTSRAWTGLGKHSSDPTRTNSQIQDREVRLIDLERLLPVRNFSNSLLRKIYSTEWTRVNPDIEQAFAYILDIPTNVEITKIGSHVNKLAYLISYSNEPYSSYNAASGEESLINILMDIFETPKDSLILIDEIEAGFHPSVQRKIADVIQYVSWHDKKQFILTTHSPSLLSAFPKESRRFIDRKEDGSYETAINISVNAAFSKMDSLSYPLVNLYCEDEEAKFIIRNILVEINETKRNFDRLFNIITSGPINEVKNDYTRHRRNFDQMRSKIGYCCVFDWDYKDNPDYSSYHENPDEFAIFLYPFVAPEKFLVQSYLTLNPGRSALASALNHTDHHSLFQKMVSLWYATDEHQARQKCWDSFKGTAEYSILKKDLTKFFFKTIKHFSKLSD